MAGMKEEKKIRSARTFAWLVLSILVALLISSFFPSRTDWPRHNPALHQVKDHVLACRAYALNHEGAYPPSLDVLYPDYLDDERLLYAVDEQGTRIPMIYHSGLKETDFSRMPLIEYPIRFGSTRIVGYVGGQVQEVMDP